MGGFSYLIVHENTQKGIYANPPMFQLHFKQISV